MRNGNLFWGPLSAGVTFGNEKKYIPAIVFDSNFLQKDIIKMLEARPWEKPKVIAYAPPTPVHMLQQTIQPHQQDMFQHEECPF